MTCMMHNPLLNPLSCHAFHHGPLSRSLLRLLMPALFLFAGSAADAETRLKDPVSRKTLYIWNGESLIHPVSRKALYRFDGQHILHPVSRARLFAWDGECFRHPISQKRLVLWSSGTARDPISRKKLFLLERGAVLDPVSRKRLLLVEGSFPAPLLIGLVCGYLELEL